MAIGSLTSIMGAKFNEEMANDILESFGSLVDIEKNASNVEQIMSERRVFLKNSPGIIDPMMIISKTEEYPMLKKLNQLVCCATISNATAERTFSALRRIKTFFRTTMNEDRLTSIALCNLNPDKMPSVEDVFERFLAIKNRRR